MSNYKIENGKLIFDGEPAVGGSLYLRGTQITELPDNLSVGGSLYLDEEKILNIGYAKYCGYSNRTIFSVRLNGTEKIAAGCFLGTYEEFCTAVDEDYDSKGAKEYKQKAQEALAMLRERTGSKAA